MMNYQRAVPSLILVASLASLGFAMTAQFAFDLEPCILCIYQRIPFITAALLAILALSLKASSSLIPAIIILCGLVFLVGAGIAVYHVGVEQHWWVSGCSGALDQNVSLEQLRASLMRKPEKACDEIDWTLFGISMATYNVFFSGGLGAASIFAGVKLSKINRAGADGAEPALK